MNLRVLSLWEPWATLIALGEKRIETRSWGTRYRGRLAIHAAKVQPDMSVVRSDPFRFVLEAKGFRTARDFPTGAIVCVTILEDVVPTDGLEMAKIWRESDQIGKFERSFGDYSANRKAWLLGRPLRLFGEPLTCRGRQGLWTPDVDLAAKIVRRMSE